MRAIYTMINTATAKQKVIGFIFCIAGLGIAHAQEQTNSPTPQVTFVCEHGVAKSVIAAAYFNQLAQQQGLAVRAIARGVNIDAQLQPATKSGLEKDGLDVAAFVPTTLSEQDSEKSLRVITIGLEQQPQHLSAVKLQQWDDVPPVSKNYDGARDVLVKHIELLIAELKSPSAQAQ